jgi:dipicolinate synthase subunit B
MSNITFGYALCGSFCTFDKAIEQMRSLVQAGYSVVPIMSQNAYSTDTRFGRADDFVWEIEDICNKKVIKSIVEAEPIGPKKMVDLMIVAPCTGNTMAKLANGITDTSVTMAVKSNLRIGRPVLLSPATNDALSASAQNIGKLLNTKNIYFVPMKQDDAEKKPTSVVADFSLILPAALAALEGKQLQPILL